MSTRCGAVDAAAVPGVLVGHSEAGAMIHAAADARPDRIARELRGRVMVDKQELHDERRYDVQTTVIACEFTTQQLRDWMERGAPFVRELSLMHDAEFVDLPTGHWPQFTRPADLAAAILAAVGRDEA